MTRSLARTLTCLALFVAVARGAAAQPAAPAQQAPADQWTYTIAPYLLLAGMSGTVGVKDFSSTIDMSASDVLSHLKGAFMAYAGAKKNGWGFGVDTIYAKLGADAVTKGAVTVEPSSSTGLYTVLGSRQLTPIAELVFGLRVTSTTTTLDFTAPIQPSVSGTKTWVDPVVGVNLAVPFSAKGKVTMLADIGGFGAASTISVDLLPAVQFRVAKHATLALGYRYIYDDYNDDAGFVYKVTMQGPLLGFVFPF